MEMYFLQYEAAPSPTSEHYKDTGGAFINCWIKAKSIGDAKKLAEMSIKGSEWIILRLEKFYHVNREFYESDDESLDYFQQAEIDGEVYVYHSWPNEPQEEENL